MPLNESLWDLFVVLIIRLIKICLMIKSDQLEMIAARVRPVWRSELRLVVVA